MRALQTYARFLHQRYTDANKLSARAASLLPGPIRRLSSAEREWRDRPARTAPSGSSARSYRCSDDTRRKYVSDIGPIELCDVPVESNEIVVIPVHERVVEGSYVQGGTDEDDREKE